MGLLFDLDNEWRGGAMASCRIGVPAVILTKLRFENQNLSKIKKQAIYFSLLLIYS